MKPIFLLLVAALSAGPAASAATRPHFGGTLRVEMRGAIGTFDINEDSTAARSLLRDFVLGSVCDRLVELNAKGEPQPSVATSWRSEREGRSWSFTLRSGVTLHNGSTLSAQMVIAALTQQNSDWRGRANDKEVLIQSETPVSNMLYQLAEPHNSICVAGDGGQWIGSGPFQISGFQAGQMIELRAFDEAWEGRPFLDRVRIQMGKSLADQAADFQLGRVDLVENDATQARLANASVSFTDALELIALVFTPNHSAAADTKLREALARAMDRESIYSVLLRRQGEASAALLPEWISGYGHLFIRPPDVAGARQLRAQAGAVVPLSLSYDGNDDLAKLIAERVSLNARDAGITLQPRPESPAFRSFNADVRLVRIRLESPDAGAALDRIGDILSVAKLQKAQTTAGAEALYAIESDTLQDSSIIPIAHIPEVYSWAPAVHDWVVTRWAKIDLGNVWMEPSR